MKCQNCNSEILEDAKFCTTCGTPVAAAPAGPVCPKCNAPLLEDAKFCTTCGAAVESAAAEAPQAPDGHGETEDFLEYPEGRSRLPGQ